MSGIATFEVNDTLKEIVAFTRANPEMAETFAGKPDEPVLLVVKDRGIYLMSGSEVSQPAKKGKGRLVTYCLESDPTKQPFDEWYDAARRIAGGDDSADAVDLDFFERAIAEGATKIQIEFTEERISLSAS